MSKRRPTRRQRRSGPRGTGVSPVAVAGTAGVSPAPAVASMPPAVVSAFNRGRMQAAAVPPSGAGGSPNPPAVGEEFGFHGTTIWDGLVRDDYNPTLQSPGSLAIYDQMRKSDSQVQMIETIMSLPVRTVRYHVEPGDESSASKEAVDLVERTLIRAEGMSMSFDDLVRKALISIMMGFQLFEMVTQELDGYVTYRKLADRHPRTVERWILDENGGIAGITQAGYSPNAGWRKADIPGDKLLRFTYREEWGNPEGFPLARVLYKNWYIKNSLYRIANIGAERDWVGTPVGKAPTGSSPADRESFLSTLEDLTTHEQSAMVLPAGYEVDSYHGGTRADAIMAYIEHQDISMARCALAAFMNLAGSKSGSNALSMDQSQFFLLCEDALVSWLCSVINLYAIRPMIGWNFPGLNVYPRIAAAKISSVLQPVAMGHALAALVNKQLITPDDSIEDAVRSMMHLPEIPPEQRGRDRDGAPSVPGPAPAGSPAPAARRAVALSGPSRDREGASAVGRAFHPADALAASPVPGATSAADAARRTMDRAESQIIARGRQLLERMLSQFERQASIILDMAVKAKPLERGKAHLALAALEMPGRADYQSWLRDLLMDVVKGGMEAASRDAGRELPAIPNEVRSYVQAEAQLLTTKHLSDLTFSAVSRLQRDLDARLGRDAAMANVRQVLRDQASACLSQSLDDAVRAATDQLSAALAGL